MEEKSSTEVAPNEGNKQKMIIGLLCALLVIAGVVLIAISMNLGGSASDNLDSTKKVAAAGQSYGTASSASATEDGAAKGEGLADSAGGGTNFGTSGAGRQAGGASGEDSTGAVNSNGNGNSSSPTASGNQSAGTQSASGEGSSSGSGSGAGAAQGSSANQSQATLEINCSSVLSRLNELPSGVASEVPSNGLLLSRSTVNFAEGASVYDVLKQACDSAGITLRKNGGGFGSGVYVTTLGPLSEFDCGSQSGWKYYINGSAPSAPSSTYKVKPGDNIVWQYTLEL